jgi:Protein of unknown function (DUF2934)
MPKTRESASPKPRKFRSMKTQPTHEQIALRAYQVYLERGATPGNELEDWTRAERELLAESAQAKTPRPRRKAAVKSIAAAA